MIAINALWTPIILGTSRVFPSFYMEHVAPLAGMIDDAAAVFKLTTMVMFALWLYQAGQRLIEADLDGLEFSPASRIWWFFIPFANLVKPYQGVRELYNASRGRVPYDTNSVLLGMWWALWLANSLMGSLMNIAGQRDHIDLTMLAISSAIDIAVALAAILLVRRITAGQARIAEFNLAAIFT